MKDSASLFRKTKKQHVDLQVLQITDYFSKTLTTLPPNDIDVKSSFDLNNVMHISQPVFFYIQANYQLFQN